ncbi:DUF2007 domain-containing protein [Pseudoluteimonas lycopersici]|uniref:DUF2007 domain-containing protein n=1 Tax=Pseudoluteimonas lycopersici TaxID=1324796 RepID=A0A516V214_9GAMM|nr:DUF2007 domain-containing protein [Lysobacter lycopersici]QDQ72550.1 DUF2007 domain-containing protein [Lysobacter lycopersici]
MRRIFASPRLENVEGVARLLEGHGIEVRITDGRSYRGAIRGNFSYRDDAREGPEPAVWIVNAEDQPRARELMRGAGLLDSTRTPLDSYLPAGDGEDSKPRKRSGRLKLVLLAAIAIAVAVGSFTVRHASKPKAPISTATVDSPLPAALPDRMAELLLLGELADLGDRTACIGLGGNDPSPDMLARLAKADARVAPLSACVQDVGGISVRATKQPAILLALRDYVRTPEGGSVVLRRTEQPLQPQDRTYDLRLDDGQWSFVAEAQPKPR